MTPSVRCSAGLSALMVLAACTSAPAEKVAPSSPAVPAPSPPSITSPRPAPAQQAVTVALAGDIHFEGPLAARLRAPATALRPSAAALAAADVAVANLETSVGTGGAPEPGKRFTFSAGPQALVAVASAGIDVVSMANNHALDFGRARLPSTMRAARRARTADPPLAVVGIGADLQEAFAPAVVEVDKTVVAILAASAADRDPTADRTGHWAASATRPGVADAVDPRPLLGAVRRASFVADVVVVYLHWGVQGERCPSGHQRRLARRLVAAGAAVVAGSHAHELQGDGRLGDGYVAYGLGNFAWYSPGPSGVLTLTIHPPRDRTERATVTRAQWSPAEIGADGLASPAGEAAAASALARRAELRDCAGLEPVR